MSALQIVWEILQSGLPQRLSADVRETKSGRMIDELLCSGHSPFGLLIALLGMSIARDGVDLLPAWREDGIHQLPDPLDLETRQRYYRESRLSFIQVLERLADGSKLIAMLFELTKKQIASGSLRFHLVDGQLPEKPLELSPASRILLFRVDQCVIRHIDHVIGQEVGFIDGDDSGEDELARRCAAEYSFIVRVWIPCHLYYGKCPSTLYHEVLSGDFESLEKLLRIDSRLICLPEIAEVFHELLGDRNTEELIAKGLKGLPDDRVDRRKHKMIWLDAIWKVGQLMEAVLGKEQKGLSVVQLRDLFNAFSKDLDGCGEADIPDDEERLQIAHQRATGHRDDPRRKKRGIGPGTIPLESLDIFSSGNCPS